MKNVNGMLLLANLFDRKYNFKKLAIDATLISRQIADTLKQAISNATTQPSLGIQPFIQWLEVDDVSISFTVNRSDRLGSKSITVSNLQLSPPEKAYLQSKYAGVPAAVQKYLDKYSEVFPTQVRGDSVDYDNFSITLTFSPESQAIAKQ